MPNLSCFNVKHEITQMKHMLLNSVFGRIVVLALAQKRNHALS